MSVHSLRAVLARYADVFGDDETDTEVATDGGADVDVDTTADASGTTLAVARPEAPDTPHCEAVPVGHGAQLHLGHADADHFRRRGYAVTDTWIATGPGDVQDLEEVR